MCTREPWSCCLPLEYVPGASSEARSEVQLRCEHGLLQELASRAFFRGLKARVPQEPPAMEGVLHGNWPEEDTGVLLGGKSDNEAAAALGGKILLRRHLVAFVRWRTKCGSTQNRPFVEHIP